MVMWELKGKNCTLCEMYYGPQRQLLPHLQQMTVLGCVCDLLVPVTPFAPARGPPADSHPLQSG